MTKYEELLREKHMLKKTFMGFTTNNPHEAIARYEAKTGFEPTVLVVRPTFEVTEEHPLLVRSRHAIWGGMMASHLIQTYDVENDGDPSGLYHPGEGELESEPNLKSGDMAMPTRHSGRPEKSTVVCPHCHGKIPNFENIGYWYGWAFGIIPPYWEELRLYVFRRDNFKCQKCQKKYPPALLNAHHIEPKEDGGEDGAKNLQTVCIYCHDDLKPIYEEAQK